MILPRQMTHMTSWLSANEYSMFNAFHLADLRTLHYRLLAVKICKLRSRMVSVFYLITPNPNKTMSLKVIVHSVMLCVMNFGEM